MPVTTTAVLQTIWDCRWSRPGYRLFGVEDQLQPEKLWVCARAGERRGVTAEECEKCPHWQALPLAKDAH
jgi:ribosomal protein L40E